MKITPIETRVFNEGDNLIDFIIEHIPKLKEKSVLAVTSKIVALAERRTAVAKDLKEKEAIIKSESTIALPTKHVWMAIKDGVVMANAGIDESNANHKIVLLPKNSYKWAEQLRSTLQKIYKVKDLGIVLTDSRTWMMRSGTTGMAVGYAGFKGIKDYQGTPDIFGRKFHFERANIADALASAAVLMMGEGKEQRPLAVIEDSEIEFANKVDSAELLIPLEDDMYKPFFENLGRDSA